MRLTKEEEQQTTYERDGVRLYEPHAVYYRRLADAVLVWRRTGELSTEERRPHEHGPECNCGDEVTHSFALHLRRERERRARGQKEPERYEYAKARCPTAQESAPQPALRVGVVLRDELRVRERRRPALWERAQVIEQGVL